MDIYAVNSLIYSLPAVVYETFDFFENCHLQPLVSETESKINKIRNLIFAHEKH